MYSQFGCEVSWSYHQWCHSIYIYSSKLLHWGTAHHRVKQYRLWKLGNTSCTSALVRTEMIGFNHHHCDNNHKDNTIEKETRNKTIKKQTTNVNKHRKTMKITPATTTILLVVPDSLLECSADDVSSCHSNSLNWSSCQAWMKQNQSPENRSDLHWCWWIWIHSQFSSVFWGPSFIQIE